MLNNPKIKHSNKSGVEGDECVVGDSGGVDRGGVEGYGCDVRGGVEGGSL